MACEKSYFTVALQPCHLRKSGDSQQNATNMNKICVGSVSFLFVASDRAINTKRNSLKILIFVTIVMPCLTFNSKNKIKHFHRKYFWSHFRSALPFNVHKKWFIPPFFRFFSYSFKSEHDFCVLFHIFIFFCFTLWCTTGNAPLNLSSKVVFVEMFFVALLCKYLVIENVLYQHTLLYDTSRYLFILMTLYY